MAPRLIVGCLAATLSVSACHRSAEDPAAVTEDEQSQLNDAAASLDASPSVNARNTDADTETDADADSNTEDPS